MTARLLLTVLAVIAVVHIKTCATELIWTKTHAQWVLMFERCDTNGDGTISKDEFRDTMQDMGWALSLEQQADAFDEYDNDEPGNGFNVQEFIKMWNNTLVYSGSFSPSVPIDVQHAQADRNGDGVIVLAEFVAGGYFAAEDNMAERFAAFDKYPKDGEINLCEVYAMFHGVDWS